MAVDKNVLLLSYVFPPYPGIGGRRWAKFAKYMAKEGVNVHVVAANNPFDEKSNWMEDIEKKNLHVSYLPSNYPAVLLKQPRSIVDKLRYRVTDKLLGWLIKGNHYDRAAFWDKEVLKKSSELIEQYKIRNIIATGAPFRVLYIAAKLKEKYPEINLISDYRDPWTNNKSLWDYDKLSPSKKEYELMMEEAVLKNSNHVITVSENMTDYLKQLIPALDTSKFLTIQNGYDEADLIEENQLNPENQDKKIKLVFAGSLYTHLEYIFFPFIDALANLKKENKALYSQLDISFYIGNLNQEYADYLSKYELNILRVYPFISLHEAHLKIKQSDYVMLFLNKDLTFSMSTKFFEYLAYKKPILVFSDYGNLASFVLTNNIGVHFSPENIKSNIESFLTDHSQGVNTFYQNFDVSPYSVNHQSKKIVDLLK